MGGRPWTSFPGACFSRDRFCSIFLDSGLCFSGCHLLWLTRCFGLATDFMLF